MKSPPILRFICVLVAVLAAMPALGQEKGPDVLPTHPCKVEKSGLMDCAVPKPSPPVHLDLQAGATQVRVGPRFVYPFSEEVLPVKGGWARFWLGRGGFSWSAQGWMTNEAFRKSAYSTAIAVDMFGENVRATMDTSAWYSRERYHLSETGGVSLDTQQSNLGGIFAITVGQGAVSGTYWRLGPSVGPLFTENQLVLAVPDSSPASDPIVRTNIMTAGGTFSAGVRQGRLSLSIRADGHKAVGTRKAVQWPDPFWSVQLQASIRLTNHWTVSMDGAYSESDIMFTPLNRRLGLGIGWSK